MEQLPNSGVKLIKAFITILILTQERLSEYIRKVPFICKQKYQNKTKKKMTSLGQGDPDLSMNCVPKRNVIFPLNCKNKH